MCKVKRIRDVYDKASRGVPVVVLLMLSLGLRASAQPSDSEELHRHMQQLISAPNLPEALLESLESGNLGEPFQPKHFHNPEIFEAVSGGIASMFGIDPSSPLYERFKESIKASIVNEVDLNPKPYKRQRRSILQYIRVAGGEALPDAEAVLAAKRAYVLEARNRFTGSQGTRLRVSRAADPKVVASESILANYTPPALSACLSCSTFTTSAQLVSRAAKSTLKWYRRSATSE